jgi:hypothetical protein
VTVLHQEENSPGTGADPIAPFVPITGLLAAKDITAALIYKSRPISLFLSFDLREI